MTNPAVSVILTAHNYGRFLGQSIESVLAQTFQDLELIVVNDGSTDRTPEVLAGYAHDPRITILTLSGVGLAAACNHGIRRSRGAYVMRLDADDYLHAQALAVEAEILNRNHGIGLVYPDYCSVDEEGGFLDCIRIPPVQNGARLMDRNPLAGGALYRRSCYDAIGGYNETLRYQEDFDFWLRFTERFAAHGIGLPLLYYRQHRGSMSRNLIPRAAARRHVKRGYTDARFSLSDERVLVVIPGLWPGDPKRSEEWLCRQLGDSSAIVRTVEAAKGCYDSTQAVVVTEHPEIRRMAEQVGSEVISVPASGSHDTGRTELLWLRTVVDVWETKRQFSPSLLILASPYCPLRHPDRFREVIDTLLMYGCDLVVSVDNEPIVPWVVGPGGLEELTGTASVEREKIVREAGELMAVRTSWLRESRAMTDARTGYVELLYPEWWCIKDEMAFRMSLDLLHEAEALNVPLSSYLRTQAE